MRFISRISIGVLLLLTQQSIADTVNAEYWHAGQGSSFGTDTACTGVWSGDLQVFDDGTLDYADTYAVSACTYYDRGAIGIENNGLETGSGTYDITDGKVIIDGELSIYLSVDQNMLIHTEADQDGTEVNADTSLFVKKGTDLTNASLNGTYWHSVVTGGYALNNSVYTMYSEVFRGTVIFNGDGTGSYQDEYDKTARLQDNLSTGAKSVGIINNTPYDSGSFTYDLLTDGKLTIDGEAAYAYVSADASVIISSGHEGDSNDVYSDLNIFIKKGSELTNASIKGTYWNVGKESYFTASGTSANTEASTWSGTVTFDGAGGCSYEDTYDVTVSRFYDNGNTSLSYNTPLEKGSCTYNLSSDGVLIIDGDTNEPLYVSENGNTLVSVSTYSKNGSVATNFDVLIRKDKGDNNSASLVPVINYILF